MPRSMFKMTATVKVMVDHSGEIKKSLDKLKKSQVLVGVPADKAQRDPAEGQGPINNAALAYIHNFGMPSQNIPARPFMEPGIKDNANEITPRLEQAARAGIVGDTAGVVKGLTAAGVVAGGGNKTEN